MGRYYKIILSFIFGIFVMSNTRLVYAENNLNLIDISSLFKQQIKNTTFIELSKNDTIIKQNLDEKYMQSNLKINQANLPNIEIQNISNDTVLENNEVKNIKETEKTKEVISLNDEQLNLLSKLVAAEARGESYEGQVAVAAVVLNRVQDSRFPNSLEGVIYQKNAFSVVKNGHINIQATEESYNAVKDALYGNDPTNDAIYFWNPDISTCNWINTLNPHLRIGNHVFAR